MAGRSGSNPELTWKRKEKEKERSERRREKSMVGFFLRLDWGKKTSTSLTHSLSQSKRKEGRKFGPTRRWTFSLSLGCSCVCVRERGEKFFSMESARIEIDNDKLSRFVQFLGGCSISVLGRRDNKRFFFLFFVLPPPELSLIEFGCFAKESGRIGAKERTNEHSLRDFFVFLPLPDTPLRI